MSIYSDKPSITFEQDAQLVSYLLADLKSEQAALVASDIDTIEKLIDRRLTLLQELSVAAKSRYDALSAHGFEPNENGMAKWLKAKAQPALNQAWVKFQQALIQAKEMNRLNGILINKHFSRNQQVLNQLQGATQKTDTYSKYGQTSTASYLRGGTFSA